MRDTKQNQNITGMAVENADKSERRGVAARGQRWQETFGEWHCRECVFHACTLSDVVAMFLFRYRCGLVIGVVVCVSETKEMIVTRQRVEV
jgi:hypothetical protein